MALTKEEMETVVLFNRAEDGIALYIFYKKIHLRIFFQIIEHNRFRNCQTV